MNYPDQDQLDPPGIRIRLAGDIVWLAVTGFAFAAIIGILCWPISVVLSPRILAGATLASPIVKSALGTGASPVGITLAFGFSANQIARPVAPLTTVEEGSERASNVASITSNAPPTEPNGTEFSPFDPNTDRPSAEPLTFRATRTPAFRVRQQNQSAAAHSQSHQPGSPRARQPRQQPQPVGRPQKSELVPISPVRLDFCASGDFRKRTASIGI